MKQDEEFLAEDNEDKEKSVLTKHERPRKMVQNWGLHSLGQGMETERFPWYFHRPIFTQLWHNFYLGVGKEDAKSMERYNGPKQHLYFLSLLLHKSLLREDYIQAAYAMVAVSKNPQHLPEEVWKCGMEVLKQCSPRMMGTTRKYQKLMSKLCPQYTCQMVLDMAFHILDKGNDAIEAYQFLLSNINNKRVKYESIFRAYVGMFEYVLWKQDISRSRGRLFKDGSQTDDVDDVDNQQASNSANMNNNAKKALENMRVVLYESGTWDVFILKMVEILDYYDQSEEAILLLESYRERNMNNPNSHRYLYWYLKKNRKDEEKQFSILQDIMKSDVTGDLALDYLELLNEKGQVCEMIDILFERLDNICCKNSEADWKMLSKLYKTHKKGTSSAEWAKLQKCLDERKDWWPKYHFAAFREDPNGSKTRVANLLKYKARIARFFENKASCWKSMHLSEAATDTESIATHFSDERSRRKRKDGRGKDYHESKFKLKKFH